MEYLFLSKCSSVFGVFLVCTVESTLISSLTELQPKLNPTVQPGCVFAKDEMYIPGPAG